MDERARDLAKIHLGAKEIGLDEATYRALLQGLTGADSAAKLDKEGRRQVLRYLERHGARFSARKHGRRPHNLEPGGLLAKMEAQLADMGLTWDYAEAILRRARGVGPKIACPLAGAVDPELYLIITALHVEQEKRQMLTGIDAELTHRGKVRADLAGIYPGTLSAGWERNRAALRRIWHCLFDTDFRLSRGGA